MNERRDNRELRTATLKINKMRRGGVPVKNDEKVKLMLRYQFADDTGRLCRYLSANSTKRSQPLINIQPLTNL